VGKRKEKFRGKKTPQPPSKAVAGCGQI